MQARQTVKTFVVGMPRGCQLGAVRPSPTGYLGVHVHIKGQAVFAKFVVTSQLGRTSHHTAKVSGTLHCHRFAMPLPCTLVQVRKSKNTLLHVEYSVLEREQRVQDSCRRWTELDFILIPVRQKNRRQAMRRIGNRFVRKGEAIPFYVPVIDSHLTLYHDSSGKWADDRPEKDIPPHEMREYVLIENYLGHRNIQGILYYNRITNEMCIGIHRFALLKSQRKREESLSGVIAKLVSQFGESVSVDWVVTHWEELKAALAVAKHNSRNE